MAEMAAAPATGGSQKSERETPVLEAVCRNDKDQIGCGNNTGRMTRARSMSLTGLSPVNVSVLSQQLDPMGRHTLHFTDSKENPK